MAYKGSAGKTFTAQLRLAAGGVTSSTLSGAVTLDGQSSNFLQYDPGGSSRNVTFPAESDYANGFFFVANAASDAGELLVLKDDAAVTKLSLDKGEVGLMFCDGTAWYGVALQRAGTITADVISELTSAAGVTIDGLLLKDGFVVAVDNQGVKLGTGVDDTISHNGTLTTWTHATGNLLIDNTAATGATLLDLGTDTNATKVAVRNNTGLELLSVSPTSATGGTVVAYGLRAVSATAAAITTTRTLTAADSGGVFSVAKTSAYAITLPTPAQGFYFKFLILDTGANAVTFSDGAAHLFGQIQEAGTVPIAMTGTTLTAAASQSVGDWLCFEGIDATHYLVTGSSIQASKFTIA